MSEILVDNQVVLDGALAWVLVWSIVVVFFSVIITGTLTILRWCFDHIYNIFTRKPGSN